MMSVSFLLSLAALAGAPSSAALAPPAAALQDAAPVEERIAACGTDTAKLWDLAQALKTDSKYADARKVMEKIVEIDPEHADARKGLGHQKYGGQWFKSSVELMMFRRNEEKAMREKGLVRVGDDWVPEADAPYMRMGWTKGDDGAWKDPRVLARLEQEAEYRSKGFEQQDLTWIPPDEFPMWDQGLWKCGEDWLPTEEADAFHSKIGNWWTAPSEHFVIVSTCTRAGVDWAKLYADGVFPELVRIFGKKPDDRVPVVLLNSLQQYNTFAAGDNAQGIPPGEQSGFSSVHHAFFAETFFDPRTQPPTYLGCGAGFWDYSPELTAWGKFSVRHAAGLSYAEAIDPSWNTISQLVANPTGGFQPAAFWDEKKIANWLRFGGATYVETYALEPMPEEGIAPEANREWAFGRLRELGGLRPLPQVFAFQRDLNDIPGSTRLNYEAGAIVCYVLDGGNAKVTKAHEAWKQALLDGKGLAEATTALQDALIASEKELRAFTGQPAAPAAGQAQAAAGE